MRKNTDSPSAQSGNPLHPKFFYYDVLTPEEKALVDRGFPPPTFDRDAALLRRKLQSILANDPQNKRLINYVLQTFNRMVEAQLEPDFDEDGKSGETYRNFVAWLQSPSLGIPRKS
jgi:hypothetical protein